MDSPLLLHPDLEENTRKDDVIVVESQRKEEEEHVAICDVNQQKRRQNVVGVFIGLMMMMMMFMLFHGDCEQSSTKVKQTLMAFNANLDGSCEGVSESICKSKSSVCSWCESKTIPSSCHSLEDARKLPQSVFTCSGVSSSFPITRATKSMFTQGFLDEKIHHPNESAEKLCDPNVKQLSGYFRLQEQNKHYFYWLFESRNDPSTDPISVWLNGGPGCSSMFGLLTENGPCSVKSDGSGTVLREKSWNNKATMIFIDQPPGTGFSYGRLDRDEKTIAQDMLEFLLEFMASHPEYASRDLYIFGESYAGHYIPAMAHRIYEWNRQNPDSKLNFKGIGIGNGLTDPVLQYPQYPEMAKQSGIVSDSTYQAMKAQVPICLGMIKACNKLKLSSPCIAAVEYCNSAMIGPIEMLGLNVYDYTKKCTTNPPLCEDFSYLSKFLNKHDVRKALNIPDEVPSWVDCANAPHSALLGDWMLSQSSKIKDLIENDVRVLIYAGDYDFICNYLGNQAWTRALDWSGKSQFNADSSVSKFENFGILRKYSTFSFLQVFKAGHMVPTDQPEAGLEMFNSFVHQTGPFAN